MLVGNNMPAVRVAELLTSEKFGSVVFAQIVLRTKESNLNCLGILCNAKIMILLGEHTILNNLIQIMLTCVHFSQLFVEIKLFENIRAIFSMLHNALLV